MSSQDSIKEKLEIGLDIEHAKCSICLHIWHDVVTVSPCLHSFCNGCFSQWLRKSQEKHLDVQCPQCRTIVEFVGRNHFLNKIMEDIMQADPLLKRSDEEIAHLESHAVVKSNLKVVEKQSSHSNVPTLMQRELSRLNNLVRAQASRIMEMQESGYAITAQVQSLVRSQAAYNLRLEEFKAASAIQFQEMKKIMQRFMAIKPASSSLSQPPPASNLPHDAAE